MRLVIAALLVGAVLLLLADGTPRRVRRLIETAPERPVPVVDIAEVAELLALALSSGRGVSDSMSAVAQQGGGRLGVDLAMVVAARSWGLPEDDAWRLLDHAWQPLARALVLAQAAGVPPSTTLAAAAEDIRRAEQHRLDVAVERLGVRLVLPLGATFLPAFVATTVVPVVGAMAASILTG